MMEKLAQADEGGGYTPAPFHSIYHHVQSFSVRSSWEGMQNADTFILFHLYPYVLCGLDSGKNGIGRVHNEDNEAETVGSYGVVKVRQMSTTHGRKARTKNHKTLHSSTNI